jgi:hypothetical protein
MDPELIEIFKEQVLLQCRFALIAGEQVNEGLKRTDVIFTFYALQNLLNAAANISKALWGERGRLSMERQDLRNDVGVSDSSPLKQTLMRNNFEHFDDRLDIWSKTPNEKNYVDLNIGNLKMFGFSRLGSQNLFRNFDPETAELTFWDEVFNIDELLKEVQRVVTNSGNP